MSTSSSQLIQSLAVALACLVALGCGSASSAGPSNANLARARKAWPEGARAYNLHCASCHGERGNAPGVVPVMGPRALQGLREVAELEAYVAKEMPLPKRKQGSLSRAEYAAIARYLLEASASGSR